VGALILVYSFPVKTRCPTQVRNLAIYSMKCNFILRIYQQTTKIFSILRTISQGCRRGGILNKEDVGEKKPNQNEVGSKLEKGGGDDSTNECIKTNSLL